MWKYALAEAAFTSSARAAGLAEPGRLLVPPAFLFHLLLLWNKTPAEEAETSIFTIHAESRPIYRSFLQTSARLRKFAAEPQRQTCFYHRQEGRDLYELQMKLTAHVAFKTSPSLSAISNIFPKHDLYHCR